MLLLLAMVAWCSAVRTIGCIGDSITAGGCNVRPNETYPAQLQQLLGPAFAVSNFGVSGMTMLTDGLCGATHPVPHSNCSWVGTPAYPAALAARSDVYTVLLGTNDAKQYNWAGVQNGGSADSFALDYLELLAQLRTLHRPLLFALTPIPVFIDGQYGMNATFSNQFIPAQVRRIAALAGAELIDLSVEFGRSGGSEKSTCDGVHPTPAGNAIIAAILAKRITANRA